MKPLSVLQHDRPCVDGRRILAAVQSLLAGSACLLLFCALATADDPTQRGAADPFLRTVAPALEARCVHCHHRGNLKGAFDITTREGMLRGGDSGPALVPGNLEESAVYTRTVPHDGGRPEMPAKGEPLSESERQALREWIAAGAPWPEGVVLKNAARADADFWSLQPLATADPPHPDDAPPGWDASPIDRFVLAALRERGLAPSSPAEPGAFIRRATYDLTGLPPTPEEIDDFVRDVAARGADLACAGLVDRLLASPHYGEQWGRHWLDVIRFGESRGYERNEIITNLWPFRDYVIRSFNDDKPFDQLVREHLAGDVIGPDQPEVEVGTAFLVAGPYDDVGNQDAQAAAQIRADQMDEMIRATSEAFLGLTMGCARCHDHKFDPLVTRDYYALYATFAGTVHGQREVATEAERAERAARLQPLNQQREALLARRREIESELAQRAEQQAGEAARHWTRPRISRFGTEERFPPIAAGYVRLVVEGTDSANRGETQFKIDEFEVWTDGPDARNVALASTGATARGAAREARDFAGAYSAALTIDGQYGERWIAAGNELVITLARPERISRVLFSSDRPRALAENHTLTTFVGDYRIEASLDGEHWQVVASSADREPPSDVRRQARLRQRVITDADVESLSTLDREIARLDSEIAAVPPLDVWWVGTHQPAPGPFHVFLGGNPQNRGDAVVPASPAVLDGFPSAFRLDPLPDEGARRLALANWITAPDNPLTPRVLANRIWQYHFGTGIVDTPSDFGFMGGRPTHPELLDWLARELLRERWKLKPLHRLIMTSQTYRQSSGWREGAALIDADSRLLWRFPPRRLTAEELRDTLLSVAGRLDLTMGGPGFRLYEYQQDNVATYVPLDMHGPETYRRAVYHHNARAARIDLLTDFDCPDPAFAAPRRAATVTPLQALTMLNHRFAVDMAEAFAERLRHECGLPAAQVQRAFRLAFGRDPDQAERLAGERLVEDHGLATLCRALLNTNELIHVE